MKRIKLYGEYTKFPTNLDSKDAVFFKKMMNAPSPEYRLASWEVQNVLAGQVLILNRKIIRWQIVKNLNGTFVLCYQTLLCTNSSPCIYRIKIHPRNDMGLCVYDVTYKYPRLERLQMYYKKHAFRQI